MMLIDRKTNGLKVGDECRLCLDWADDSLGGCRVKIVAFVDNGNQYLSAVVKWLKDPKGLRKKYGVKFSTYADLEKVVG